MLLVILFCALSSEVTINADDLTEGRPNIVFFLVDDMGLMDTSVLFVNDQQDQKAHPILQPENRFFRTPGMERLAKQGTRFSQFYAMSVCSPTRITLMTGQNAARHRTTNWINPYENNRGKNGPSDWNWSGLSAQQSTLPKLLQRAGYRTIHIGKGHFGPELQEGADPINLGFDINIGGSAIGHPGSYFGIKNFGKGGRNAVPHLDQFHGQEVHLTDLLTLQAKEAIDGVIKTQQPFFLNFCHYAVHSPFESDHRFAANYRGSDKSQEAQAFATLIEGMDHSLTDLLDHLESAGVAEETVIFFMGDNGSDAPLGHHHEVACAAPFRGRKGTQYEGGMRAPLIAAWGRTNTDHPLQKKFPIASGNIQTKVVSVCDLYPTTLELAGIDFPPNERCDGFSLQNLLNGQADQTRPEEFLMHFPHEHRDQYFTVFRQGEWKVIYHYFPQDDPTEQRYQLFNLADDLSESNNLAENEPDQLSSMMKLLIERLNDCNALYPVDDARNPVKPELPKKVNSE